MKGANYNLERIEEIVNAKVWECEKRINEIENMPYEKFLALISRSIFGVASKGYYINALRRRSWEEAKFYSKERVIREISEKLNRHIYFIPLAQKLLGVEIKERKWQT